jgi:DNA-binding MarR family transcriptional regulator
VAAPRWLDSGEERAWRAYLAMNGRLAARLNRRLQQDSELSLSDFEVLVHLTDRDDERVRAFELAREMQWEKSRLSHQLARMQRRGLIDRVECPEDGRGAFVVLTPDGRAVIDQAAPHHVDAVREYFLDQLTEDELRTLGALAERVLARLEDTDT